MTRTPKGKTPSKAKPSDEEETSVKAKKKTARLISELARITGTNQKEVLESFERQFEDAINRALLKRQNELQRARHQ